MAPSGSHPPEQAADRDVAAMGGRDRALAVARRAWVEVDHRWCAEVGKHLVFADEADAEAAGVLAAELPSGRFGMPASASPDLAYALSVSQLFDSIAVRLDGQRAWDEHLVIARTITDEGVTYLVELRTGVLHHRTAEAVPDGSTHFTLSPTSPSSRPDDHGRPW